MSRPIVVCVAVTVSLALIGLLIVVTAPPDVLAQSGIARAYVSMMSHVLPLDRYASNTAFPQIAKLYYGIIWITFPFVLVVIWAIFRAADGKSNGLLFRAKDKMSLWTRAAMLVLSPLWFFLAYVGVIASGSDTRLFNFGSSLWQMGTLGMLIPLATALSLALGIGSIVKAIWGRFV